MTTAVVLLLWCPSSGIAQAAPAPPDSLRTHVVQAGETLWGLAARYYGDGRLWRSLARRNGIPVTDYPPLPVGTRLTVPARPNDPVTPAGEAAGGVATPATAAAAKPAAPAGSLTAQTAGTADAVGTSPARPARPSPAERPDPQSPVAKAPATTPADTGKADRSTAPAGTTAQRTRRVGLVDQDAAMAARKPGEVETVFHRDVPDAIEAERRTRAVLRPNTPTPRNEEYLTAPFVLGGQMPTAVGRITARVGSPASVSDVHPQRAIKTDVVEIEPPSGSHYQIGDRLMAFVRIPMADGGGEVIHPSGVLEVIQSAPGKPALAVVRLQSGRIEAGQQLLPAPAVSAPWVKTTRLETPDVETTVRWLDAQEAQPTLQSFVIVGAGRAKGLTPGDEMAIYRRIARGTVESLAATVRVVRVEQDYATTIITRQYQPDIQLGLTVRRYAKAP